jgi:F0F1-type ATP synthase assembly protein I
MKIESGFPSVGITVGVALGGIAVLLWEASTPLGVLIKTIMVAIAVVFVIANLTALVVRARKPGGSARQQRAKPEGSPAEDARE